MTIETLKNSELSSVIFIRDYLQFVFEGEQTATLTAYTLPLTFVGGRKYNSHTVGYRDALVSLINQVVKESVVQDGHAISIIFDNGDGVEISLKEDG
ncbi:hypothetical protein [Paenibacillus cremeus]|nr:hypothetical protein [Paenibacillus cremeus]